MSCIYNSHRDSGTGRGLLIRVPEWFRHRNFFFIFGTRLTGCRSVRHCGFQKNCTKGGNLVTVQYSVAQKLQRSSQVTAQLIMGTVKPRVAQQGVTELSRVQRSSGGWSTVQKGAS